MNIVSINVNGLNAYYNKGALDDLISRLNPDILCMQEIKCNINKANSIFENYPQYITHINGNSFKSGYAGVATLVKNDLDLPMTSFEMPELKLEDGDIDEDKQFDMYSSGRIVKVNFEGFTLYNVYVMNSGSDKDYYRKLWDKKFRELLSLDESYNKYPIIITGDLNVVSDKNDYWGNYYNAIDSGPGLFKFEINDYHLRNEYFKLVDAFRSKYPDDRSFSWYSYRDHNQNHGWRLDYFLISESLMKSVVDSKIFSNIIGSDHRPIQLILKDLYNEY